ncbi:MAG: hypothetical protein NVS4B6_12270 [Mycobacterium sp.]
MPLAFGRRATGHTSWRKQATFAPYPAARRAGKDGCADGGVIVESVIPLPRPWLLASAMLVGIGVGQIAAVASKLLVKASIRPDFVIALVVCVPGVIGMLLILFSGRRWVTALGAFILAIAPGWFGILAVVQVVHGA